MRKILAILGLILIAQTASAQVGPGPVSYSSVPIIYPHGDPSSIAVGTNALSAQTNLSTGKNIGIGVNAGDLITSGVNETILGNGAGINITTGSQEIAIGISALGGGSGAALTGNYNTGIGQGALTSVTGTATENTCVGAQCGAYISTGTDNIGFGDDTLGGFTASVALTGSGNDAFGWGAGSFLQAAETNNTLIGDQAGRWVTASSNTAVGQLSLAGQAATNETGNNNTAVGLQAERFMSSGTQNSAFGAFAMTGIAGTPLTGAGNSVFGYQSGTALQGTANANTFFGYQSGKAATTAANNLILGYLVASTTQATGSGDILLGTNSNCDTTSSSTSNVFLLCASTGSTPLLQGNLVAASLSLTDNGAFLAPNLAASSAAQTGTVCWTTGTGNFTIDTTTTCLLSLEETKDILSNIDPMQALSEEMKLKPFWFSYKKGTNQADHAVHAGLGAHQVEGVDKRLVGYDPKGKLQGVRYADSVTSLNVAAIKGLQQEVLSLKAANDNLSARLAKLERHH